MLLLSTNQGFLWVVISWWTTTKDFRSNPDYQEVSGAIGHHGNYYVM